jgi:hypothetical protein
MSDSVRLAFCSVLSVLVLAQTESGVINGTVSDTSGAAVPGARVMATNANTNVVSVTDTASFGGFTITAVPVGTYSVRVEKQGFKAAVRNDVIVTAGNTITLNVRLEVGSVTESIVVGGSTGPCPDVQRESVHGCNK